MVLGAFPAQGCDEARTYIFLLLMNVTDLEPNVLFSQWARRVIDNVLEALRNKSVIEPSWVINGRHIPPDSG
jgi:hypothetical protein